MRCGVLAAGYFDSMEARKTEALMIRLTPAQMQAVDEFRRGEEDLPNRQEAIRRLLAWAMDARERADG